MCQVTSQSSLMYICREEMGVIFPVVLVWLYGLYCSPNNTRVEMQPHIITKHKSCEIYFVNNIHFCCPILLKFCTEHGSDTAMLFAKFQKIE